METKLSKGQASQGVAGKAKAQTCDHQATEVDSTSETADTLAKVESQIEFSSQGSTKEAPNSSAETQNRDLRSQNRCTKGIARSMGMHSTLIREDSLLLFIEDPSTGSRLPICVPRGSVKALILSEYAIKSGTASQDSFNLYLNGKKLQDDDLKINSSGLRSFTTLRLCQQTLVGGAEKLNSVSPAQYEMITTTDKFMAKQPTMTDIFESDVKVQSETGLLTSFAAIAENRNVDVYYSADEACEPLRIKLFQRVNTFSSTIFEDGQRNLLKKMIDSFELKKDEPEIITITTCLEQMLKQQQPEVPNLPEWQEYENDQSLSDDQKKLNFDKACSELYEQTWKLLSLQNFLMMIVVIQPSKMIKLLGKLPKSKNELLNLMQMARHPNFIEKLNELLPLLGEQDEQQNGLVYQIQSWLSTCQTDREKQEFLLKLSAPEFNAILWRQLKPDEMRTFVSQNLDENKWNPYLLKNCSIEQIQLMSEKLPPIEKFKLFTEHLKHLGLLSEQTQSAEKEKEKFQKFREKLTEKFPIDLPNILMNEVEVEKDVGVERQEKIKVVIERFEVDDSIICYQVDEKGNIKKATQSKGNLRIFLFNKQQSTQKLQETIPLEHKTSKLFANYYHHDIRVFYFSGEASHGFYIHYMNKSSYTLDTLPIKKETHLYEKLSRGFSEIRYDPQLILDEQTNKLMIVYNDYELSYLQEIESDKLLAKFKYGKILLYYSCKPEEQPEKEEPKEKPEEKKADEDKAEDKKAEEEKEQKDQQQPAQSEDQATKHEKEEEQEAKKEPKKVYRFFFDEGSHVIAYQPDLEKLRDSKTVQELDVTDSQSDYSKNWYSGRSQYMKGHLLHTKPWEKGFEYEYENKIYRLEVAGFSSDKLKKVEEKNVEEEKKDKTDQQNNLKEDVKSQKSNSISRITIDDPVVCIQEIKAPSSVFFGNLRDPCKNNKNKLHQFDFFNEVIACAPFQNQFYHQSLGFTARSACAFGVVRLDRKKERAQILTLILNDPLQLGNFANSACWRVQKQENISSYDLTNRLDRDNKITSAIFTKVLRGSICILQSQKVLLGVSQCWGTNQIYQSSEQFGELLDIKAVINPEVKDEEFAHILFVARKTQDKTKTDILYTQKAFKESNPTQLDLKLAEGVEIRDLCYRNGQMHLLDSEGLIHKFNVNESRELIDYEQSIQLEKNQAVQQAVEVRPMLKDIRFTKRAMTTCQKIIMHKTREEVDFNCGEEMLESGCNLIVTTSNDRKQLNCMINPASRQAIAGDQKFSKNIISTHQLSQKQLLIQQYSVEFGDNVFNECSKKHSWIILSIDGSMIEMPQDLRSILDAEEWQAQSYTASSGRLGLVLTTKQKDVNKIERILQLGVTEDKQIAFYRELSPAQTVNENVPKELLLDDESKYIEHERLLLNQNGALILLRMKKKSANIQLLLGNEVIPKVQPGDQTQNTISVISEMYVDDLDDESTDFAYAGDYVCWRQAKTSSTLLIFDVKNQVQKKFNLEDISSQVTEQNTSSAEQIANAGQALANTEKFKELKMNASDPIQLLLRGCHELKDIVEMDSFANNLQITLADEAYILDLEGKEVLPIKELADFESYSDPENYPMTSFQIRHGTKKISLTRLANLITVFMKDNQRTSIYQMKSLLDYELFNDLWKEEIQNTDDIIPYLITANFEGSTLISMAQFYPNIFDQILEYIDKEELNKGEDQQIEKQVQLLKEWLNHSLQHSTLVEKFNIDKKLKSNVRAETVLSKQMTSNTPYRDRILNIGQYIDSFSILKHLVNQKDLEQMLDNYSVEVHEALNSCLYQTVNSEKIMNLELPRDINYDFITLMQKTTIIKKEELDNVIQRYHKKQLGEQQFLGHLYMKQRLKRAVRVSVLDMSWFLKALNFADSANFLKERSSSFIETKFFRLIMDRFWEDAQREIFRKQFLPHSVFICSAVLFFHYELTSQKQTYPEPKMSDKYVPKAFAIINLILIPKLFYTEYKQLMGEQKHKCLYFIRWWNWPDLFVLTMTGITSINQLLKLFMPDHRMIDLEVLQVMGAVSSGLLMVQFYNWLRLFDNTAFYVRLITQTMHRIRYFLLLFVVALALFGLPLNLLNQSRFRYEEDSQIVKEKLKFWLFDVLYNQYLLALGEFETLDTYTKGNLYGLAVLCFVLATFFTQITMLNMLIAIMGDVYAEEAEQRHVQSVRMKLQLLSEMAPVVKKSKANEEQNYFMIVIEPIKKDDDLDEDDWQGSVKKLSSKTRKLVNQLKKDIYRKSDRIQTMQDRNLKLNLEKTKVEITNQVSIEVASQLKSIEDKLKQNNSIEEIKDELNQINENVKKEVTQQSESVKQEVTSQIGKISGLKEEVSSLIESVKKDLPDDSRDFSENSLKLQMTSIKQDVNKLDDQVSQISGEITSMQKSIFDMNAKMDNLAGLLQLKINKEKDAPVAAPSEQVEDV